MRVRPKEPDKTHGVRKSTLLGMPLTSPILDLASELVHLAQNVNPCIILSPFSTFTPIKEKFAYLLSENPQFSQSLGENNESDLLKTAILYAESLIKIEQIKTSMKKGKYVDEVTNAKQIIGIGDVHGDVFALCQNLLNAGVIVDVRTDLCSRDPKKLIQKYTINQKLIKGTQIVLSGDYVDRGKYSLEVIDFMRYLKSASTDTGTTFHFLCGNHDVTFLKVIKLFGKKPASEIERALKFPLARFDFTQELAEFVQLYDYFDINISKATLKEISFNFPRYGFVQTYESILRKYGSWENAVLSMESDGTLDFIDSLKGAVIIDGNFFTHAGPPLFADSIEELEQYYEFAFTNPLSSWASLPPKTEKEFYYNPNIAVFDMLVNNISRPFVSRFDQVAKAMFSQKQDLSISYISNWDGITFEKVEIWLGKMGLNHLYVGHNGESKISVRGIVTNLDARMSEFYDFPVGGSLVLDPLSPVFVKSVYYRSEVLDKCGSVICPHLPSKEENLTDSRFLCEVFQSEIGDIMEKLIFI